MSHLFIGLMSGTSLDGIDAVLADFSQQQPVILNSLAFPWPESTRQALFAARRIPDNQLQNLTALSQEAGHVFAHAVNTLLEQAQIPADKIAAIGNHGQTIRHRPDADTPFSLQIGDPLTLAKQTGIAVISDFRSADITAGGQGAPLVPAFHEAVFRTTSHYRVIVNIGGIANLTILPDQPQQAVTGFDSGPGNSLMDGWVQRNRGIPFDHGGQFARTGKTHATLLARLLQDDYFSKPPPKSTGFEHFNIDWLTQHLEAMSINSEEWAADIQSTLCDLTVTSIVRAINQYAVDCDEVYLCGGGAHNTTLFNRIQTLLRVPLASTEKLGLHPDWIEALTFAWLAKQRLDEKPANLPSVTGARERCLLGKITAVPNAR